MVLTSKITACTSVQELQQLLDAHEGSMNHINVSAMLVQLARLQRQPLQQASQVGGGMYTALLWSI